MQPKQTLNPAFLKLKSNRCDIDKFKLQLTELSENINYQESEEFHKNLLIDFLQKTYYQPKHFINTKGRTDLVIHNGKQADSTVGVIIELKRPSNKTEMLQQGDINKKALQELVLYYLQERIEDNNLEIKHLIVTNIYEWFIFDARVFEREFVASLSKQFTEFKAGRLVETKTDFFYKQIAKPAIAKVLDHLEYTYFDLRDYGLQRPDRFSKPVRSGSNSNSELVYLFKLLSPEHLLKLPFINDSNSLDKNFYSELLHIIGLQEVKHGGKKLIELANNAGSLLDNIVVELRNSEKVADSELFNVGLELVITWINRILFLKLLEAQLISYHGDISYAFLNIKQIKNFHDLNSLFFQVLARKVDERDAIFAKIPYLNSSLFEVTEIEKDSLFISQLASKKSAIFRATVLKDSNGKKRYGTLDTLQYLLEFLDAYDFSSEGSGKIQEENKSLINASVLGLIFEKINGYKDGSFFTPGFITMYMCRETIRRAVVQKFNETKGWNCKDVNGLYEQITDRKEANAIINDLKICDPAVGSGHFLVSALNEIVAIKHDLRILLDRNGRRLKEYEVKVVNDELIVLDEDGELFEYKLKSPESQRVQEALFHEKQTIIENCLFGVDVNVNSVKICRLRLWIELLKHTYYKADGELETLPNIDINIKCGNSLISRFELDVDLRGILRKSKWSIEDYREAVATYRNAESKEQKREMVQFIEDIKGDLRTEIGQNDPKLLRLNKLRNELGGLLGHDSLFPETVKEKKAKERVWKQLEKNIAKLEAEVDDIKNNKIYRNAFEWRFEFPEVLNEAGDFVGFDVVIGNPPYGVKPSLNEKYYFKNSFNTQDDIYSQFFELGIRVLKNQAISSFITPITWLNGDKYFNTRNVIKDKTSLILGIILPYDIFTDAYVDTGIFCIKKSNSYEPALVYDYNIKDKINYQILLETPLQKLNVDSWTLNHDLSIVFDPFWRQLKTKIYDIDNTFGLLTTSFRGILAPNESYNESKISDKFKPVFTHSFRRYDSPFQYLKFVDYSTIKEGPKDINSFEGKKLFIRRIVSRQLQIMATYSDGNFAVKKDVYVFKPKDENTKISSLLAILNSKLISFLLVKGLSSARKDDFTQITLSDIRKIGVPSISPKIEKVLKKLVNQILAAKKHNPKANTSKLEAEIDQLVYKLYGLTEEEIEIVENG
ncbi:MAG: Eco57I restriction-modification methylase domain-containing protein [Candidatus Marithrix sp.]